MVPGGLSAPGCAKYFAWFRFVPLGNWAFLRGFWFDGEPPGSGGYGRQSVGIAGGTISINVATRFLRRALRYGGRGGWAAADDRRQQPLPAAKASTVLRCGRWWAHPDTAPETSAAGARRRLGKAGAAR